MTGTTNNSLSSLITQEELQIAFQLLDTDKTGTLTLSSLKKRLGPLFPDLTAKEYRFLMNNKKEITLNDLKSLLSDVIAPVSSNNNNNNNFNSNINPSQTLPPTASSSTSPTGYSYDPVQEAFRAFDPLNTGKLNDAKLREAFLSFGFGELADDELDVIKKVRILFNYYDN